MLTSSSLHPVLDNHYGTRNRTALLTQRLQVVRTPHKDNNGSGPEIYLSLWQSSDGQTRDLPKPLNGVSPANRRHIRKEKSMDRAIPPDSNINEPQRLDAMAGHRLIGPQQSEKRHYRTIAQSNSDGLRTNPRSIRNATIRQ